MHMQSTSSAVSTPACDRRPPHNPTMAALLHTDRLANEPSCSGSIEWSIPVETVLLPAARASTGWSVRWQQCRRRDVARRTFRCTPCRRHVDRRPSCSASNADGHAWVIGAGLHRLRSRWHTSAASIHPSLASGTPAWSPTWKLKVGAALTAQQVGHFYRSWTGTQPSVSSVCPSSLGPHGESVRGGRWRAAPEFVHNNIRTS